MARLNKSGAALLALGVIATGAAGCKVGETQNVSAAAAAQGAANYTPPKLTWTACTGLPGPAQGIQTEPNPALECAKLTVPLNYAKPQGQTIDLAVIRLKTTGAPENRIGSLVFNPGGPGGSGVDTLSESTTEYRRLRTRYDLVSFDPRGVQRSAPIQCATDKEMDASSAVDGSPDTPEEEKAYLTEQKKDVKECTARSGKILPYVGTVNAARDMEVLRKALGDRKLYYFGTSYGTWLGANYAHQFPGSTGRLVLDAAVNTKLDTKQLALQQAASFQKALGNYAAWEAQQPREQGATKEAIIDHISKFLKETDYKPVQTQDKNRALTQDLAQGGVMAALYSRDLWPTLTAGLVSAFQGDGTLLMKLNDLYSGRDKNGHYDNSDAAGTAVRCDDTTKRYTVDDVKASMGEFTQASPLFGQSMAWSLISCTGWPAKGDEAGREVSAPKAAPIVVVGNLGDPATPYDWAPALTKELGSGVLLTLKGEGHGAYETENLCVRTKVNGYLLYGRLPAQGTVCE
ncbi:alpha/beta fold hydrolase [Actinomadura barringtoniae]|uniref:Alpha/beta fold hydrolase n=1 Tax=Actinomadura barringtoniae TaxID=1427535 RepID=A0A939P7H2_9ACTN|nr:alpha/beta hydrolase [Actinomadura barringtoniae]MBO2446968.1 alpha/beta fold hydrolase [Actinomadura barringtoniae]